MAIPQEFDFTKFEFPDFFIDSADTAHLVIQQACDAHRAMWASIDQMEEHFAGELPYDPEELKKKGLSWMSNRNYGKARAKIEKGSGEQAAGVLEAVNLASITFDTSKSGKGLEFLVDRALREQAASILTNALIDALEHDDRFYEMILGVERSAFAFGYSPVISSQHDWLGEWYHPRDIAFEPDSTIHDCRTWITFDTIDADYLYREYIEIQKKKARIEDNPDDERSGHEKRTIKGNWIEEGIAEVLYHAYVGLLASKTNSDGSKTQIPETWDDVLGLYVKNASSVAANTAKVNIAKIFRREFDGSFTEVYMAWNNTFPAGKVGNREVGGDFNADNLLYKKNHGDKEQWEVLTVIRDSGQSKDGCIHDLRGIAKWAYADSIAFDAMKNDLVNKLTLQQPIFERENTNTSTKFALHVFSGYTLAPRGWTQSQSNIKMNFQDNIALMGIDEAHYLRETSHFDNSIDGRLTSRPTTQEVATKQQELEREKRGRTVMRLKDYGMLLLRMLRDASSKKGLEGMAKASQQTFRNSVADSVSQIPNLEESFDLSAAVSAVSSVVLDPVNSNIDRIERALLIAENPFARNRLRRQLLLAYGFPRREINAILPPIGAEARDFNDQRIAIMENADLMTTREVAFTRADDHIVHLDTHFTRVARLFSQIDEGRDLLETYVAGVNYLSHTERHVEAMIGSPFYGNRFKQYAEHQRNFVQVINKLRPLAERQKRERDQQDQSGFNQEMAKFQQEMQIKQMESQFKMQRTKAQQEHRAQMMKDAQEFRQRLEEENAEIKRRQTEDMGRLKEDLAVAQGAMKLLLAA